MGEHRVLFTGTLTAWLTLWRTSLTFFPKYFWRFTKLKQLFLWKLQEGGKVPGVTLQSGSGLNVDLMEPANFSSAETGISEVSGTRGTAVGSTPSPYFQSDACNSRPGVRAGGWPCRVSTTQSAQTRIQSLGVWRLGKPVGHLLTSWQVFQSFVRASKLYVFPVLSLAISLWEVCTSPV